MRICRKCKTEKPLSDFSKLREDWQPYCKKCVSEYMKIYSAKNKDVIRQRVKEFTKNNPELVRKYKRDYYARNKQLVKDRANKWKVDNREKFLEGVKRRKPIYRDKYRAMRLYRFGMRRLKNGTYKETYRNKEVFTDITVEWLNNLFVKSTHCELCNCEMDNNGSAYPNGKQLDHILPLIVGGTHMKNNVRFICFKCNVSRPNDGSDIMKVSEAI